jgi:propionyl-CoA synthetase
MPGAFWRVISEHGASRRCSPRPTAFRAIKKEDPNAEHLKRYDCLSRFRTLFLAGERCDPDT